METDRPKLGTTGLGRTLNTAASTATYAMLMIRVLQSKSLSVRQFLSL